MIRRGLMAVGGCLIGAASAFAQTPPTMGPVRLRGTIDSLGSMTLELSPRTGGKVHVAVPATTRIVYIVASKMSDIQPGSYIGTAAAPQPDGTLRALEVHVFPPSMRGAGEGSRPWEGDGGKSTMTNGTVGSLVSTNGRVATVNYGSGEKKVLIPDDVPVVSFEPADLSALTAGAKVIVSGQRGADGTVTATAINVGKDGLTPPM